MTWHIERDYINGGPGDPTPSRVGRTIHLNPIACDDDKVNAAPVVRFRILDDDDVVYYGGWLNDDDECLNQISVGEWAMRDAGATVVQVKRKGVWTTEVDV